MTTSRHIKAVADEHRLASLAGMYNLHRSRGGGYLTSGFSILRVFSCSPCAVFRAVSMLIDCRPRPESSTANGGMPSEHARRRHERAIHSRKDYCAQIMHPSKGEATRSQDTNDRPRPIRHFYCRRASEFGADERMQYPRVLGNHEPKGTLVMQPVYPTQDTAGKKPTRYCGQSKASDPRLAKLNLPREVIQETSNTWLRVRHYAR